MIKYIIYTQKNCIYCSEAKSLLDDAGEVYEERELDTAEKVRIFKNAGHKTVPQIFLHIGGFHELEDYFFGEEISFKPDMQLVEDIKPSPKGGMVEKSPFYKKDMPKIGAISGDKKVISFAEKRAIVKGRKLMDKLEKKDDE